MLHAESVNALHHPAKAKRVIYLFQSGGPSQIDLFDHKPRLKEETGKELPDSVRKGQRLTGMSGNQASLPPCWLTIQIFSTWTEWTMDQRTSAQHRKSSR